MEPHPCCTRHCTRRSTRPCTRSDPSRRAPTRALCALREVAPGLRSGPWISRAEVAGDGRSVDPRAERPAQRSLLAGAPDGTQVRVLKRIIKKGLSVRQAEELVRSLTEQPAAAAQNVEDEEYPESYSRLVEQLEKFFSQDISIKRSKNGGGRIVIGFGDDKDIEQFIERFSGRIK